MDQDESDQLRAVIASINWAAREGRPEASAAASILPSAFPSPTIEVAREANRTVRMLKEHRFVIRIWPIPEQERRLFLGCDAGFDTSGKERSQCGWLIGCTTNKFNLGETAPMSLLGWRSRRMKRKAASSMLCEALCLSSATAELEWLTEYMDGLSWTNYADRVRKREELAINPDHYVLKKDNPRLRDPAAVVWIDAKSLYDALNSEQTVQEDRRAALEIAVIRESFSRLSAKLRWLPHDRNPCDPMTKVKGAHTLPLTELLRSHTMRLQDEKEVLDHHADLKEEHGYLPRPRVGLRATEGATPRRPKAIAWKE